MDWDATMDSFATQVGNKVQSAVETGIPTQVSYGFVCGYCSGYALKKIGKAGAIVFGLGFMTLQTLQYSGYITVDHDRMKNEVTKWMDFNEDGKVDKRIRTLRTKRFWQSWNTTCPPVEALELDSLVEFDLDKKGNMCVFL